MVGCIAIWNVEKTIVLGKVALFERSGNWSVEIETFDFEQKEQKNQERKETHFFGNVRFVNGSLLLFYKSTVNFYDCQLNGQFEVLIDGLLVVVEFLKRDDISDVFATLPEF